MDHSQRQAWDVRDIIQLIQKSVPQAAEIYLFGSRRYGTGSKRSDIDLLLRTSSAVGSPDIRQLVHDAFPPADIFKTHDLMNAESMANGSVITLRHPHEDLVAQLEAVSLWKEGVLNSDFSDWIQITAPGIDYRMTFAEYPKDVDLRMVRRDLAARGLPDTILGNDWVSVGWALVETIERASVVADRFNRRAASISRARFIMETEYDFQNVIATVIQPWIPSFEREAVPIRYDGQDKFVDFNLMGSNILIEAKHIKDANTKAAVLKDLDGLRRFYASAPTCKLILCLILCEVDDGGHMIVDSAKIAADFSDLGATPVWITHVIANRPPA